MSSFLPYARQSIDEADIAAVVRVLRSDFLTQGPEAGIFEGKVAARCGVAHAVALSSCTAGLHLACLAMGLGPGDRLWTSPVSFVASANCARYCGAEVDFVDIDPRTYNLSVSALEERLSAAEKEGKLPKIIVTVHFAGQSCDMEAIRKLADRYGFRIIEDAAHAMGAEYGGEPVGNCHFSDCTVFSFHAVKILTSGEGGMVVTNDRELAGKVRLLSSHGVTRDRQVMHRDEGPWYYEQVDLGFHYRMTDIQAALGSSQMDKLESFLAKRREIVAQYDELLKDATIRLPWQDSKTSSSWHLYVVRVPAEKRRDVFTFMREGGIGVNVHYLPIYLQPDFASLGFRPGHCPEAEAYYAEAITLPVHVLMGDGDAGRVVERLKASLS